VIAPEQEMVVKKRDGRIVTFDRSLIAKAMEKAFRVELGLDSETPLEQTLQSEIVDLTNTTVSEIANQALSKQGADVERIQDVVEMQLMRRGHYSVARRYIVYREEHSKIRALHAEDDPEAEERHRFNVNLPDGSSQPLDPKRIRRTIFDAGRGLGETCSVEELESEVHRSMYDGITPSDIHKAVLLAARARIERDPSYGKIASRLALSLIYREALGATPLHEEVAFLNAEKFASYVQEGVDAGRLAPELLNFDLEKLAGALNTERDSLFPYLGLQTIYDRYLLHINGRRIETPQYFWMRVAMGLSILEGEQKNERAIQFYNILSTFRFISATPTLFNSGTCHPQLSSCYLSTAMDDLEHIFKVISDNAALSKWAGGLGNDWTNVRATNSHIKGTNGRSQGIIPFLKVVSDTAVAVNQGGKRKGAVCSYLETWHLDIEEFLDLRKNTGDDRRRTHDMHTANWIPDLFMKRVVRDEEWTLFSPDEVSDLHDSFGKDFEEKYTAYEAKAGAGEIGLYRKVSAKDLWRKMLTRLFETGHPWITFKDPSNIRSPQDHVGVVHSSNLCTEILLNTSREETAVCNLGSVNLSVHITNRKLDLPKLEETVRTAVRMLDNVIDINYYPTAEAQSSNRKHRPVGLGQMGFQDALYAQGISYASQEAVEFSDMSMEAISYYAILASTELAKERGTYSSYEGSKWSKGLLPIDTIKLLQENRGEEIEMDDSVTLEWDIVRKALAENGMRNSNVMAIAPTATISTIIGVTQSIEPTYKNLFVKSNLSGDFTQINEHLVNDLKQLDLWDDDILDEIKYYDGSLLEIDRIPDAIKQRYLCAFEVDPEWIIKCGSRRQKWIDMGMSLNLYLAEPSGKKLHDMYMLAWKTGLKTTYYLRTVAATQIEKSTVDVNKFGIQPRWMKNRSASSDIKIDRLTEVPASEVVSACSLDGDCEACQ